MIVFSIMLYNCHVKNDDGALRDSLILAVNYLQEKYEVIVTLTAISSA